MVSGVDRAIDCSCLFVIDVLSVVRTFEKPTYLPLALNELLHQGDPALNFLRHERWNPVVTPATARRVSALRVPALSAAAAALRAVRGVAAAPASAPGKSLHQTSTHGVLVGPQRELFEASDAGSSCVPLTPGNLGVLLPVLPLPHGPPAAHDVFQQTPGVVVPLLSQGLLHLLIGQLLSFEQNTHLLFRGARPVVRGRRAHDRVAVGDGLLRLAVLVHDLYRGGECRGCRWG